MPFSISKETRRNVSKIFLLGTVYLVTAWLGLQLDAVSGFATLIWPPTGIAFAVILKFGYRFWPAIFLGAFFVNAATGAPPWIAASIALGNTLEAYLGAFVLIRFFQFNCSLNRVREVLLFFIFAVLLSPVVSATVGVLSLVIWKPVSMEGVVATWLAWWMGDALGSLIVTPLLLSYSGSLFQSLRKLSIEKVIFSILLVGVGVFVFADSGRVVGISSITLPYLFFPLVIWAAFRFETQGGSTTVFLIAFMAVVATLFKVGPFSSESLRQNLLLLNSFLTILALTTLFLSAAISERKAAILEKQRIEKSLQEALKVKDDFLSVASHELKTPLTSLSLQIQMIERALKKESKTSTEENALASSFDLSVRQLEKLNILVEDLLNVSRIRNGQFNFLFEENNFSELMVDVTKRFSSQFEKVKIKLKMSVEEGIIGVFDRVRIEQILNNLYSNAIKYAPGKDLTVSVAKKMEKNSVELIVRDSGPGIPLEKQGVIFEKFERLIPTNHVSGLGLGLYIVREIVKGHSGTIDLQSALGQGVTFTITLPLAKSVSI